MSDTDAVIELLTQLGIPVSGAAISDTSGDSAGNRVYVFVPVHRSQENRQLPTNKSIEQAKSELALRGIYVDFILTDGENRDAESGLRATLLYAFGDYVRNVFLSTQKQRATVWLDLKKGLEAAAFNAIAVKTQVFLNDVGLKLGDISSTASENVPTNTAILGVIRRLAPIEHSRLKEELEVRQLSVPSDDWLARRLDLLRKHGSLVRSQDGHYALSLSALRQLGTSKNAASPDIKRLLTLASGGK